MTNRPPLLHRIASYLFGWEWHYNRWLSGFDVSVIPEYEYHWELLYQPRTKIPYWPVTISSYRYMPTLRRLRRKYRVKYIELIK
jgi:hypothetical protein